MGYKIKSLLKTNWESIIIHNGNKGFRKYKINRYFFSIIVLIQKNWVEIFVEEIDEETFYVGFEILNAEPIDPKDKKNNPPLMTVEKFPEDCRLDHIMKEEIEGVKFGHILEEKEDSLLVADFEITLKNGYVFKFFPAEWPPGNVEIEMQPGETGIDDASQ